MNHSACIEEVGRLLAAFPQSKTTSGTADVYVEALVGLRYAGALHDAVDSLLASERWLPTIALVREEYKRCSDKHQPPALEEAPLSDEEVAANKLRWKTLNAHLKASGTDGHASTFEVCEHPDCAAVRDA